MDLFRSFHQVGVTLIVSTHDEASVGQLGGRHVRLGAGALLDA